MSLAATRGATTRRALTTTRDAAPQRTPTPNRARRPLLPPREFHRRPRRRPRRHRSGCRLNARRAPSQHPHARTRRRRRNVPAVSPLRRSHRTIAPGGKGSPRPHQRRTVRNSPAGRLVIECRPVTPRNRQRDRRSNRRLPRATRCVRPHPSLVVAQPSRCPCARAHQPKTQPTRISYVGSASTALSRPHLASQSHLVPPPHAPNPTQAPVSFRAAPRLLARALRTYSSLRLTAEHSLQSITDNPVVVDTDGPSARPKQRRILRRGRPTLV